MSRNWWNRVAPAVAVAGDVGGDGQISEAYSARWWHALADGRFAVIDRAYYVVDRGDSRVLECRTEYVICRDWERPGDTEEGSDACYGECDGDDPSAEDAYDVAEWGGARPLGDDEWGRIYPWATLADSAGAS